MIPVLPEFKQLTQQFQLAVLSYKGSWEGMIDSALSKADDDKRRVIQKFLSDLLSEKYGSDELRAFWASMSSDFFIQGDEELISFLRLIQERIQQNYVAR
jgi:hypothetical protein